MDYITRRAVRIYVVPLLTTLVVLLVMSGVAVHLFAADGSKGKARVYDVTVAAEQGDWYFKVEVEPILFRIVSVQNKYKVLRINIVNRSRKPLRLSLQDDRLQIRFRPLDGTNTKTVGGLLDIARTDNTWWSSLDTTLQKALAYPDQAAIRANEEENVFVFVPAGDLPSFPDEILFTIKSHSASPIILRQRSATTAA
jgi:hypothetical protein